MTMQPQDETKKPQTAAEYLAQNPTADAQAVKRMFAKKSAKPRKIPKPRTKKVTKKSPRKATTNVTARDQAIFKAWKAGTPVSKLAAKYERTPQRIGEILLDQAGSRQVLKRLRAKRQARGGGQP